MITRIMNNNFWNFDGDPNEQGWYAVIICYDEQEGAFPCAAYWSGDTWNKKAVVAFGEKRETESEARRLSYEHDPDA